ncbi:MAG: hypothetical protein JJ926_03885 [Roseitalea sp.]|nr:hypothetical protein [Roseitalea sp.]MBO6950997.1 hypothetical protein [Rhizobiaceae bacterium]
MSTATMTGASLAHEATVNPAKIASVGPCIELINEFFKVDPPLCGLGIHAAHDLFGFDARLFDLLLRALKSIVRLARNAGRHLFLPGLEHRRIVEPSVVSLETDQRDAKAGDERRDGLEVE